MMKMTQEVKKEMTPQEEEAAIQFTRGRSVSLQFMRRHPEFKSNENNAKKLSDWIKANERSEWNSETLEKAYAALKGEVELNEEPVTSEPAKEAPPLPEWGLLTNQIIKTMPLDQYQRFYKDPEFRRQVENVSNGRSQFDE
jgi:hypothetical protein